MKTIIFIVLSISSSLIFSQSNFNVEWESPAGTYFMGFCSMERSNGIPEIILRDQSYNIKIYDGATKQQKYSYSDPDSSNVYILGDFPNTPIDFNNDGINDIIFVKNHYSNGYSSKVKIVSGASGQVMFQQSYTGYYSYPFNIDIDGDGYIEILLQMYSDDLSHLVILSTESHTIGIQQNSNTVTDFKLGQNYPNPFNPVTEIAYSISKEAQVQIVIYNEIGQIAGSYINEKQKAGEHKFAFDGTGLASGVYFYQIIVNDMPETKKMVLIK